MVKIYNAKPEVLEEIEIDGGRTKNVGFNARVIGRRLASGVYRHEYSGPRELIANSSTSIEEAIDAGILERKNARIRVKFYADGRLEISDNGMGISREVLDRVLSVMGNSTNFDPSKSGQMGMGFYAFLTVSSVAYINTMTSDGKSYSAICRDAQKFDIFEKSDRTERGTTITLQLYDGGEDSEGRELPVVDRKSLIRICHKIGTVSMIPMTIDASEIAESTDGVDDDADSISAYEYSGDGIRGIGLKYESPVIYTSSDEIDVAILTDGRAENDYLCGMPINIKSIPSYIVVNIKDERKYTPMPDRERLTKEAEAKVGMIVKKMVHDELDGFWGISDHKSLNKSPMNDEFRALAGTERCDDLMKYAGISHDWDDAFKSTVFCIENNIRNPSEISLLQVLHIAKRPAFMTKFKKKIYDGINATDSDITAFWPSSVLHAPEAAEYAEKWGIPSIMDELKADKLKVKDLSKATRERRINSTVCHVNFDKYNTTSIESLTDDVTVIMAEPGKISDLVDCVKHNVGNSAFIRYYDTLPDRPNVVRYRDWIDGVLNRVFETNRGPMKLSDILKTEFYHSEELDVHLNENPQSTILNDFKQLYVFGYNLDELADSVITKELGINNNSNPVSGNYIINMMYGTYVGLKTFDMARPFLDGLDKTAIRLILDIAAYGYGDVDADDHVRILSESQKVLLGTSTPATRSNMKICMHYVRILYPVIDAFKANFMWGVIARTLAPMEWMTWDTDTLLSTVVIPSRFGVSTKLVRKDNKIPFKIHPTTDKIQLGEACVGPEKTATFQKIECAEHNGRLSISGSISISEAK